jgi:hypothetical protein
MAVGAAASGTSPGNGYVDLAFPNELKTSNFGVEGGYQTSKATFAVRWDYSKFENAYETLQFSNPYFGNNLLDTVYLALTTRSTSSRSRQLPRPADEVGRVGAVHVGEDDEHAALRPDRAELPARCSRRRCRRNQLQRREHQPVVCAGVDGRPVTNVDTRLLLLVQARQQVGPGREYGHSPTTLASGLGCGSVPAYARTPCPGNCDSEKLQFISKNNGRFRRVVAVRAASASASGTTTTTSTRRVRTTTSRSANKVWAEYKNTMLDTLAGRLKYEYISRDSTIN